MGGFPALLVIFRPGAMDVLWEPLLVSNELRYSNRVSWALLLIINKHGHLHW